MRKLKTKFLMWFMRSKPYRFILKYVVPPLEVFKAPGPSYLPKQDIRTRMQPGDILLSKARFRLTNLLIGGSFSHAAIVVGKDRIAEMTANNFDIVDVNHFCSGATRVALLRIKDATPEYRNQMAMNALAFAGAEYDTDFELGVKALYCSELCYQADNEKKMQADLIDLVGMGRPYISPSGIYEALGLEVIVEWEDEFV